MTTPMTLFTEAFMHRLLPYQNETTLEALRSLQPADYPAAAIWAGAGALIASAIIYAVGIWLRRLPERVSTTDQRARIEKMRVVAREWLPYLLILSPTPIGGVLIMAAGFFAIRHLVVILAVIGAEVAWRAAPLLGS